MWKKQIEKETSTKYVKKRGSEQYKKFITSYFYCHRSGQERLQEQPQNRKRAFKSQGTCKSGINCTSCIKMQKYKDNGSVVINYCLQHTGHGFRLAHQTLSDDLTTFIVGKLAQGVEITKILDEIRNKITDVNRDTLLTRRDIQNIKKQYNIAGFQKHQQDGQSVDIWVSQLSQDSENPVIFYKAQSVQRKHLQEVDFLLCIQTPFKRSTMQKYAKKIICIDSTHCTTQYDFLLTTVLVLDDFEEAVPVAWAISNREDAEILYVFFLCYQKIVCSGFCF